jgi:hypothetical protein
MSSRRDLANNSLGFAPTLPPTLKQWQRQQIIVEPTWCARERARMR